MDVVPEDVVADAADQPVRPDQAVRRVDGPRLRNRLRHPLLRPALLQRGRLRPGGTGGSGHPQPHPDAVQTASSRARPPRLFGDDYPTDDGTCVRDYIHVSDLADAHVAALEYLDRDERKYDVFNVGTGEGTSVRQIVDEVKKVTGLPFTETVMPRRAGDPAAPDRLPEAHQRGDGLARQVQRGGHRQVRVGGLAGQPGASHRRRDLEAGRLIDSRRALSGSVAIRAGCDPSRAAPREVPHLKVSAKL